MSNLTRAQLSQIKDLSSTEKGEWIDRKAEDRMQMFVIGFLAPIALVVIILKLIGVL